MTKRERDAEATSRFLELAGWTGEFLPVAGVDQQVIDRFWSKVELAGGHWLWTRATVTSGAGQFAIRPSLTVKAHRLAWELMVGNLGADMVLVRDCTLPHCVNPKHYTRATKTEAASAGGRQGGRGNLAARGEKITVACSQRVVDILTAMHRQGRTLGEVHAMGRRAGLGPMTIQHIIKGNAVGAS